jgi:EAL domain-containing protein (putative c-di-GMP-specific phosphodiesterase class I)
MHYLRRLPFDTIKIDKSFIDDLPDSKDAGAIVTAIITLAHSMELEVIAEGVETRAQLDFVRGLGCHATQGYVFSKPVSFDEVSALLGRGGFPEPAP